MLFTKSFLAVVAVVFHISAAMAMDFVPLSPTDKTISANDIEAAEKAANTKFANMKKQGEIHPDEQKSVDVLATSKFKVGFGVKGGAAGAGDYELKVLIDPEEFRKAKASGGAVDDLVKAFVTDASKATGRHSKELHDGAKVLGRYKDVVGGSGGGTGSRRGSLSQPSSPKADKGHGPTIGKRRVEIARELLERRRRSLRRRSYPPPRRLL
ncbi:hypothetical protein BJ165DRAFT_1509803 [Panaeolus papilionaceus]|nr:hypothetical protein BJ165DRAFT_1509803 [Panaeolus papilionaceus]